jgi:hypothetical protein
MSRVLSVPRKLDDGLWLDEAIWGHRLHNVDPTFVLLEFLTAAEYKYAVGKLLEEPSATNGKQPEFFYRPAQRLHLRFILSNDFTKEAMDTFPSESQDEQRWIFWNDRLTKETESFSAHFAPEKRDFSYVRNAFNSFSDFAKIVDALKGFMIEHRSNKRWSSRFLFPFGPHAVYVDLGNKLDADYNNFSRTGEILYLMLSRSKHRNGLIPLLERFFDDKNPWDILLQALDREPPAEYRERHRQDTFLPYAEHQQFDDLSEDWISLLSLRIPFHDIVPHLITVSSFHVVLYQLKVACELLDRPQPRFICEVVAPSWTTVRKQSIACFDANRSLSLGALEAYINNFVNNFAWRAAINGDSPVEEAKEALVDAFGWKSDAAFVSPDDILQAFRREARERHARHVANVHSTLGRGIGLISTRGRTNRNRYAPSDSFLRAMVLANVSTPVEFREFLDHLYRRYGLAFSKTAAEDALPNSKLSRTDFEHNADRLERRLASLGLLKRQSDGCAYIINPFVSLS